MSIHKSAAALLQRSQDPSVAKRLISCAHTVMDSSTPSESAGDSKPESWEGFSFKKELHAFEKTLIERALRTTGGSVTKASRLLGFKHHQSLISLINTRHEELLKTRSAVRKRKRHLFSKSKRAKRQTGQSDPKRDTGRIFVLHVEDNKPVAQVIRDLLSAERMEIDTCVNGMTALRILTGEAHYDAIIVDNDLPGVNGLELVRRVRNITHRRQTPIIMLSGDEIEKEAWRVGVDEFLLKPKAIDQVASTITRLLKERKRA